MCLLNRKLRCVLHSSMQEAERQANGGRASLIPPGVIIQQRTRPAEKATETGGTESPPFNEAYSAHCAGHDFHYVQSPHKYAGH